MVGKICHDSQDSVQPWVASLSRQIVAESCLEPSLCARSALSKDAADDAAFGADGGAVNGHGLRAGHERDDGGDFLGRFKALEDRGRADIGEEPFLDFGL